MSEALELTGFTAIWDNFLMPVQWLQLGSDFLLVCDVASLEGTVRVDRLDAFETAEVFDFSCDLVVAYLGLALHKLGF